MGFILLLRKDLAGRTPKKKKMMCLELGLTACIMGLLSKLDFKGRY